MSRAVAIDIVLIVLCIGMAIFVGTDLGGWWFPFAMGLIVLWSVISIGVKVAVREPAIIRIGNLQWTKREACRHFFIIGGTGSGKTEAAVTILILQLVENVAGIGGLALDAKGDFRNVLEPIYTEHGRKDDIVILETRPMEAPATWRPKWRVNLFSNPLLGPDKFVDWMADALGSIDQLSENSFFDIRARIAIKYGMLVCQIANQPITFSGVRAFLLEPERQKRMLEKLKSHSHPRSKEVFNWFHTVLLTENKDTLGNIFSTIDGYTSFFSHPEIEEVFWSSYPTISLGDVERGKMFLINVTRKFDTERSLINTIVKNIFCDTGLGRFERPSKGRNVLVGVLDECQNHLSVSKNGMDDAQTFDKLRAADVIIIAATQLKSSIVNRLKGDQHKASVVLGNLTNWFIFKAEDKETAEMCADKIGKKEIKKKIRSVAADGKESYTYNDADEYVVKPDDLRRLRVCQCWVVHTNTNDFPARQMTLPPRKANGDIADWWKNPSNR